MYKIQTSAFIIDRVLNNLVITPVGSTPLIFTVTQKGCNNDVIVIDEQVGITEAISYAFFGGSQPNGHYVFQLTGNSNIVHIYNYDRTLNDAIRDIKQLLCKKCNCNDCDCNSAGKKCLRYQNLYNKLQSYLYLNRPFILNNNISYSNELHQFFQDVCGIDSCYINEQLCSMGIRTHITAEVPHSEELFKYYISMYYLGIYFYNKYSISTLNDEQIKALKLYFSFDTIKRCLSCPIDIEELEEIYTGGNPSGDYVNNEFSLTGDPLEGEAGVPTTVNIDYNIISNDDIITRAYISKANVEYVDVTGDVNQGIQTIAIPDITIDTIITLTVEFTRRGIAMTQEKDINYAAVLPQWYGTSVRSDMGFPGFVPMPTPSYDTLEIQLNKVIQQSPEIEVDLAPEEEYIWFVSNKANARISASGFNTTIGDWDSTTAFFIKQTADLVLSDGITTVSLTFYRTRETLTHSDITYKIY